MISVTELKNHWHQIFNLAIVDGFEFKVKHRPSRKVFIVSVTPTFEPYPKSYWSRRRRLKKIKGKVDMNITSCPACGKPVIAGICVTKGCTQVPTTSEKAMS